VGGAIPRVEMDELPGRTGVVVGDAVGGFRPRDFDVTEGERIRWCGCLARPESGGTGRDPEGREAEGQRDLGGGIRKKQPGVGEGQDPVHSEVTLRQKEEKAEWGIRDQKQASFRLQRSAPETPEEAKTSWGRWYDHAPKRNRSEGGTSSKSGGKGNSRGREKKEEQRGGKSNKRVPTKTRTSNLSSPGLSPSMTKYEREGEKIREK